METTAARDVFSEIRADHDLHRVLLERVAADGGGEQERHAAFRELAREVGAHTRAEERVFYSQLLGSRSSRIKSAHSLEEHERTRDDLRALSDVDLDDPAWVHRFQEMARELRIHMEEEERSVFPLADEVLDEITKRTLGRTFRQAQREELGS